MSSELKQKIKNLPKVIQSDAFFEKLLILAIMMCITSSAIFISINFLTGRPLLDAQIIYFLLSAALIYFLLLLLVDNFLPKIFKSKSFLEFFMSEKRDEERKGLHVSFGSLANLASETSFVVLISIVVLELFWGEINLDSTGWGAFLFVFMLAVLLLLMRHIVKNLGAARFGIKFKSATTKFLLFLSFTFKLSLYYLVSYICSVFPLIMYIKD